MAGVTLVTADGNMLQTAIVSGTGGDMTVVTGVANKIVRVYRLIASVSGSTGFTFKSSGTALTGVIPASSMVLDFSGQPWFTTSPGFGFVVSSSASLAVGGIVHFTQTDTGFPPA